MPRIYPRSSKSYNELTVFGDFSTLEGNVWRSLVVHDDTTAKDTIRSEKQIIVDDYVSIDGTKAIRLDRRSTVWDDLRIYTNTLGTGPSPPDFATVLGNLSAYRFAPNQTEVLHGVAQLPHSYKEGTDLEPHIHWTPVDSNSGHVVWTLEWSWANMNEAFGTTHYSDMTVAAGVVSSNHYADFGGSDEFMLGTGKKISSIIWFRIFRKQDHPEDDYGSDAVLFDIDFHHQIDAMGSVGEHDKNINRDGSHLAVTKRE